MLQASLKVVGGKNDGKLIEFKTRKFLVGREQDCHLRPNSDLVSRHHCVFTLDDYALRLRDLGSTNGTLVNGRRIRGETVLTPGDVVRIGKLNLEVVIGSTAGAEILPSIPHLETTINASGMETAFNSPVQTTLDDSGMFSASPSSETVDIEIPMLPTDLGSDGEIPMETDTLAAGGAGNQTPTDHPVLPQTPVVEQPFYPQQQNPPEGMPPNGWQYPQYPQYPQYQQFPGYPMAYPPGYPPGYGYPTQQPGGYSVGGYAQPGAETPQPAAKKPDNSGDPSFPDIRLPNPEDTGVKKEAPKPAAPTASSTDQPKPQESTPSKSAADLINSSRRRRRDGEGA